jgi:aspartokinase-like uncharacterized kinase
MKDRRTLNNCLDTIAQHHNDKIVIVPGGGVFADQVRMVQQQWGFNDQIAHEMAILAMQQMALIFKSINDSFQIVETISQVQQTWHKHVVVICTPNIKQLNDAAIKASWDVSSDSLAAWVARQLNAQQLILVKSVDIPLLADVKTLQAQNILDPAFSDFVKDASYKITVINKHRFCKIME